MSLLALFPFLRLITGRVWVYIALAACVGCFLAGWQIKGKFEAAKQLAAVNKARVSERDAASIGSAAEKRYLSAIAEMENIGHEKILELQKRLASTPRCDVSIPAEWVRNDVDVPSAAGASVSLRPPAAAVAQTRPDLEVRDARDVVLNCERNRVEVAEPNALQLRALQDWYRQLRERYNR